MKTKEELNALKKEIEALNKKLAELTEDELMKVTGGVYYDQPKSAYDDCHVNPEDSCYRGTCGSCSLNIGGKCIFGKGIMSFD